MRAFTRGAAFLASVVLLAACLRAAPSGTRHPWTTQAELRWTEAEDIDNLNPLLTTEILVTDLSAMTQGYLVRPDASGTLVPSLALTVPTQANHLISRDGKTIVYKLRHGAVWHDGRAFTSADVAFSVATILDPRFNVANRIGFDDIARVNTPNPYSVIVHLKEPYSPFVSLFLTPHVGSGILPVHLLRGHDLNHAAYNALPLGLGPFRYVKWSRGSEVELAAFDRWWGGRPKLRRILYRVIPDATAAVNQLRTHELDGFARIPNEEYPSAKAVPGTRTLDFPTTSFDHIDFNVQTPCSPTAASAKLSRTRSIGRRFSKRSIVVREYSPARRCRPQAGRTMRARRASRSTLRRPIGCSTPQAGRWGAGEYARKPAERYG